MVGAGITGALISDALLDEGYAVTVVDRRDVGQGSTCATTAMLQYEIDVSLVQLSEMIGHKGAVACYKAGIESIKTLSGIIKKRKLNCGFQLKDSPYLAHSKKAAKDLFLEYQMRNEANLGVEWLGADEVLRKYGMVSHGAILSDIAASTDAYKLTHELMALNIRRELKVYDQTDISEISTTKTGAQITTKEGNSIQARTIVFCNGFESTLLLKEKVATLFYSYACVSEQNIDIKPVIKKTLFGDTQAPYLYFRTTDDNRLMVGGLDEDKLIQKGQQKISVKFKSENELPE